MIHRSFVLGVVVACSAAAACGQPRPARHHVVVVVALRFEPETLLVAPGDTITWRNEDLVPHTVSAEEHGWDSGLLAGGREFTLMVDANTPDRYRCRYHPEMQAVLVRK